MIGVRGDVLEEGLSYEESPISNGLSRNGIYTCFIYIQCLAVVIVLVVITERRYAALVSQPYTADTLQHHCCTART
jgi:hypothetical protein